MLEIFDDLTPKVHLDTLTWLHTTGTPVVILSILLAGI